MHVLHQAEYEHVIILHCISGQTLSTAMVNAGLTSFSKIEQTNPRELELVKNTAGFQEFYVRKNFMSGFLDKFWDIILFFSSDCQQTSTIWQPNQRFCQSSPEVWGYSGAGKIQNHFLVYWKVFTVSVVFLITLFTAVCVFCSFRGIALRQQRL